MYLNSSPLWYGSSSMTWSSPMLKPTSSDPSESVSSVSSGLEGNSDGGGEEGRGGGGGSSSSAPISFSCSEDGGVTITSGSGPNVCDFSLPPFFGLDAVFAGSAFRGPTFEGSALEGAFFGSTFLDSLFKGSVTFTGSDFTALVPLCGGPLSLVPLCGGPLSLVPLCRGPLSLVPLLYFPFAPLQP